MANYVVKCRKCGEFLFQSSNLVILNAHQDARDTNDDSLCQSLLDRTFIYVNENEKTLPTFISEQIQQGNWTKGKVTCPKCGNKIGSFNFVSSPPCSCGKTRLPAIQIISSKTDVFTHFTQIQDPDS